MEISSLTRAKTAGSLHDVVIEIMGGVVQPQGDYDSLFTTSALFRKLVGEVVS